MVDTRPVYRQQQNYGMELTWTEVNNLNTQEIIIGLELHTAALAFGGTPAPTGNTELWNGTNWTEVNNLNTARQMLAGGRNYNTAALAFGGAPSRGRFNRILEWN